MGDRQQAKQLYDAGLAAARDTSNPDHLKIAYKMFADACMADPTWDESHYQAGNNNSDLQALHASVACWRRALECETVPANKAKIMVNMGWRLHNLNCFPEALTFAEEAVRLDPNLHLGWVNLSTIHQTLNQPVEAARCARMGYALKPDDPLAEMQLAFALLHNRELVEGFKHLEIRFKYKLKSYLQFPYPKWKGESDKTVYLVADQGLGDTLSFARFVPAMCKRVRYVHALIQPELLRLFSNAFVGIPNLNLIPQPAPFPQADCWSTFVSIPQALELSDQEIRNAPDIDIPTFNIPRNWRVPDRKLHIGIAWAGSPLNDLDKWRNIPVHHFGELYRAPGVQLYSLQVGDRGKDMHDAGFGPVIQDLRRYIMDVADTMALLQHLDLVITCESAMGHIAAACGKECWLPYSRLGKDYRLGLDGTDRLWTPKHRIFNQHEDAGWDHVFQDMVEVLRERVDVADDRKAAAARKRA